MLTVTENAKKRFETILKEEDRQGQGIRVRARQGISPFAVEYGLAFVESGQEQADDKIIEKDGLNFYIDPGSEQLLDGATLDFVQGVNESGFKITNPNIATPPKPTGPLAEKVEQVINSRINPSISAHGGFVGLVDVKDDVVYLQFGGGCHGCGMANVTLKQGVEVMIKEAIPEIKEVRDITDHAGGTNPYYKSSG